MKTLTAAAALALTLAACGGGSEDKTVYSSEEGSVTTSGEGEDQTAPSGDDGALPGGILPGHHVPEGDHSGPEHNSHK